MLELALVNPAGVEQAMFMLSKLLGLPAHPLVVHAAVILVPLAVVALVATGWRKSWRDQYSLPIALIALAGGFFAFLADQSGEPLEHAVRNAAGAAGDGRPNFGEHPEQGEQAFLLAIGFAIAAVLFWLVNTYGPKKMGDDFPEYAPIIVYGIVAVVGLGALFAMVAAGHSGAQLVWKDVGSYAAGR